MNSVETYLFEECQLRVPSCKYQTVHVIEELQEPFRLGTRQTPHSLQYGKHRVVARLKVVASAFLTTKGN